MALVIMGWKSRAKEAKCGSIWVHFSKSTIHQFISQLSMGGGKLPVLQARVLGDGDINGEVTFPFSTSRPGNLFSFTKQPILQTRSSRLTDS